MTEQNRWSDDAALSAWLDGELTNDEAQRLRERLAREPALAERLEQLSRSDATLREAYGGVVDEPLPSSVLELLRAERADRAPPADASAATGDGANVVELESRRRARPSWFSLPAAAAAGIALVVGVLVGQLISPGDSGPGADLVADAGVIATGTPLHEVLQSVPSGETRELGASLAATPRLTFRTQNGEHCRQVDVTGAQGATETLACRRGGVWRLEVASFTAQQSEGVYRPAAGASTPVRAAVDEMIAGTPLGAEAEQALIANDWAAQR